jgi:hypothetical protein
MKYIKYHQIFESNKSEYLRLEINTRKNEIDFIWDILSSYEDEGIEISFGLINPDNWMRGVLVYRDSVPYVFFINDYFSNLDLNRGSISDFKINAKFEYFLCLVSNSSELNKSMSNCLTEVIGRLQESYDVKFLDKCYYRSLEVDHFNIVNNRHRKIDFSNLDISGCSMISEIGLNFDILR